MSCILVIWRSNLEHLQEEGSCGDNTVILKSTPCDSACAFLQDCFVFRCKFSSPASHMYGRQALFLPLIFRQPCERPAWQSRVRGYQRREGCKPGSLMSTLLLAEPLAFVCREWRQARRPFSWLCGPDRCNHSGEAGSNGREVQRDRR